MPNEIWRYIHQLLRDRDSQDNLEQALEWPTVVHKHELQLDLERSWNLRTVKLHDKNDYYVYIELTPRLCIGIQVSGDIVLTNMAVLGRVEKSRHSCVRKILDTHFAYEFRDGSSFDTTFSKYDGDLEMYMSWYKLKINTKRLCTK